MKNNLIVVILLVLALIFGSSLVITTNKPQWTLKFKTKIFDWAIFISSDNFIESKYFAVEKPGNYLIHAEGSAPKGQITISILNSSGKVLQEIKGSHLKKEHRLYLSPGKYQIIVRTKNSKHNNYRIYINKAK